MKKMIVGGLAATAMFAASMAATGVASASPSSDERYVACATLNGLHNDGGPNAEAAIGRLIANDISSGRRDPLQERDYVYQSTNSTVSLTDANALVNCSTEAYLGFGPR